jgi:hypothetical protein
MASNEFNPNRKGGDIYHTSYRGRGIFKLCKPLIHKGEEVS